MTESSVTGGPSTAPAAPKKPRSSGGFRRVAEWFWLGSAMRAARTDGSALSEQGRELLRRARLASELGARALEPAEAFANGPADALACEMYRETIYWGLHARKEMGPARGAASSGVSASGVSGASMGGVPSSTPVETLRTGETATATATVEDSAGAASEAIAAEAGGEPLGAVSSTAGAATAAPVSATTGAETTVPGASGAITPALWESVEAPFLAKAAGGRDAVDGLRAALVGKSFADYAELEAPEQSKLARNLRAFADGLTSSLDVVERTIERLWFLRLVRIGALATVLIGGVFLVRGVIDWSERRHDLARGAEWEATSKYPEAGCASPDQYCSGSPNFFFHTNEEDGPAIVFDLGEVKTFSGVTIKNRVDCCYERAVPLVVDVSKNRKKWYEVARRQTEFTTWSTKFEPTEARYLRVHVPRKTNLHLREVRILP